MWRRLVLLFLVVTITACTGAGNDSAQAVETSVAATLTALAASSSGTPPVAPSATNRAPTRTPPAAPTPDPLLWDAILGYQDVGVPLPKSARTFGGGIYVPDGAAQDVQTAQFTDEVVVGVGAYSPNEYDGDTPILLPDGTGIEKVEFYLFDPNGNTVYQSIDDEKPFCLFGDADGRCTPFDLEANNCLWLASDGIAPTPVTAGFHQLNVSISGSDALEDLWFATLDLLISPDSPCATPGDISRFQFDISGCCNDTGQRNDEVLSAEVSVNTAGYLGAEVQLRADAVEFVFDPMAARRCLIGSSKRLIQ